MASAQPRSDASPCCLRNAARDVADTLKAANYRPTKLFIGGLSQRTTSKSLRDYFSKRGRVLDCVAMCKEDGKARSFGFVTFASLETAIACVDVQHVLDGHKLDVKLAVAKANLIGERILKTAVEEEQTAPAALLRPPPGLPPPGLALPPQAFKSEAKRDDAEESDGDASTATPSCGSTRADSDEETAPADRTKDEELPSLGSALHAAGECKPCNFFARGKCSNGKDCGFCHLPHQARRATRQEKRDRAAKRLQQHVESVGLNEDCDGDAPAPSGEGSTGSVGGQRQWSRCQMLEVLAALQQTSSLAASA